jgi:hypothetical protein
MFHAESMISPIASPKCLNYGNTETPIPIEAQKLITVDQQFIWMWKV